MSHELLRLTEKICNTPLMVTDAYLDKVMQILESRNNGVELAIIDKVAPRQRKLQYFADKKLGVVDIHGGITDIPYHAMCEEEGVSHQSIREEVQQLIEAGAKTIVLDQASSGGTAHMAFESADFIRNLADDNGVKLISYISSHSFSASYVYTAVAHEVISNPTAQAGSIGVRVQLRNMNGYLQKMGIEDIYITAGEGKVPFTKDGKFSADFIDEIQADVLEMYQDFTSHVAMWRGKDQKDVVSLGAKTYTAKKSLESGLIDKVMTLEEFKSYLDNITTGEEMSNPISNLFKTKPKEPEMANEELGVLQASLEKLTADFSAFKTEAAATLSAKDAELETALVALKAAADEKLKLKTESRKASLEAVVGKEKAGTLLSSLSGLDDTSFQATLSVLETTMVVAEAAFSEQGDEGEELVTDADEAELALSVKDKNVAELEAATIALLDKKYNKGTK